MVHGDTRDFGRFFSGKNVLITGGCGSVGSAVVKQLLALDIKIIRIFDNNEYGLFNMQSQYKDEGRLRFLVGDVRDKTRLHYALKGIDVVFHAAALKHVPLCEYNPFEAIKTNVIGTQNVIEAAIEESVDRVLLISTDKAVNPVNTMGATKLLCERLVIAANGYKGSVRSRFSCVRFGNVLNSKGSVYETFYKQISEGGPVTLTSSEMRRFVMLQSEAAQLILEAASLQKGGEIFILKMPVLRVEELARVMIEEYAPKFGFKPAGIRIEVIGERAGEKTNEELMTQYEVRNVIDHKGLFIVIPQPEIVDEYKDVRFNPSPTILSTAEGKLISKAEIRELIKRVNEEEIVC